MKYGVFDVVGVVQGKVNEVGGVVGEKWEQVKQGVVDVVGVMQDKVSEVVGVVGDKVL